MSIYLRCRNKTNKTEKHQFSQLCQKKLKLLGETRMPRPGRRRGPLRMAARPPAHSVFSQIKKQEAKADAREEKAKQKKCWDEIDPQDRPPPTKFGLFKSILPITNTSYHVKSDEWKRQDKKSTVKTSNSTTEALTSVLDDRSPQEMRQDSDRNKIPSAFPHPQSKTVPILLEFQKYLLPKLDKAWGISHGLKDCICPLLGKQLKNCIFVFSLVKTDTSASYTLGIKVFESERQLTGNHHEYYILKSRIVMEISRPSGIIMQCWTDTGSQGWEDARDQYQKMLPFYSKVLENLKHSEIHVFRNESCFDRANDAGKLNKSCERGLCILENPVTWMYHIIKDELELEVRIPWMMS
jgi:hypothetical protein